MWDQRTREVLSSPFQITLVLDTLWDRVTGNTEEETGRVTRGAQKSGLFGMEPGALLTVAGPLLESYFLFQNTKLI